MINLNSIQHRIPAQEYDAIQTMANRIETHRNRHKIRQEYYDGVSGLKDLGISIPPSLRNLEVALGWPSIAVDSLAQRIRMEGFVLPSGDISDYGIDLIAEDNQLAIETTQTTQSALLQGCAFIATFRGDVQAGEPEVITQSFPATHATGLYRPTSRRLGAALMILEEDSFEATRLLVMFDHVVYLLEKGRTGWNLYADVNTLGRVSVHLQPYNPSLSRPFGKSHLSRDMMSITDSAMRTVARMEVGAEFFVTPQRYLLGAHEDAFLDENGEPLPAWDLMMGRMLALPFNEDAGDAGTMPEVGTFQQMSMQPHSEQLRTYSGAFAGAAGIPVSSLGIIHDNPASAEGVNAVRDDLIINAESAARTFTPALVRAMQDGAQILNNSPESIDELRKLTVRWADPTTVSRAQAADAALKMTTAGIIPPDSDVALEMIGLSEADIHRVKAHRDRAAAPQRLADLVGTATPAEGDSDKALSEAQVLKTNADTLGILRRAGVDAESAAQLVGLEGVTFIPGEPITIKAPEDN